MAFEVALSTMAMFFLILAVGFTAGKLGIITEDAMPRLASLCTKVLLPAQLFSSTFSNATREMILSNLPMIALAAAFYLIIFFVTLSISKAMRLPHDKDRVFQLCFMFGNTGFVGFPLLSAMFPEDGILFLSLFTIVDQALFWTLGVWLSTARDRHARFSPTSLVSPNIVAMAIVYLVIFFDVPVPSLLSQTIGTIANATSAVCMIYLGAMLCFSNWKSALRRPELYVGVGVKMIALPIAAALAFRAAGIPADMAECMTVIMALPVMTVVPMVAKANGDEGDYATGITAATLVICVLTIPLVAFFSLA